MRRDQANPTKAEKPGRSPNQRKLRRVIHGTLDPLLEPEKPLKKSGKKKRRMRPLDSHPDFAGVFVKPMFLISHQSF